MIVGVLVPRTNMAGASLAGDTLPASQARRLNQVYRAQLLSTAPGHRPVHPEPRLMPTGHVEELRTTDGEPVDIEQVNPSRLGSTYWDGVRWGSAR
jgi:hypothetical protein